MSWRAIAEAAPELAAFGAERLHDQVAYLATLRSDGSPRLSPVRPIVTADRLFLFMDGTSPKVRDLERDGRCALHGTATSDQPWDFRELVVEGTASRVEGSGVRATAGAGTSFPRDESFLLFELEPRRAMSTTYGSDGRPIRRRWSAA